MKYNYLIVGAGLFGAVFATEMAKIGRTSLVIDRRDHIGGNAHMKPTRGIHVHVYGAHIFHTSNDRVWEYVNQFARFNHYVNAPVAVYRDELYNLPFNMNTFHELWGVRTPREAKEKIDAQIAAEQISEPKNLEEVALSLVGRDVYEKLIKGYTQKQWGRACDELPGFIIKRLPLRFVYNNNYFNDKYQGIPIGGYTKMVEQMLDVEGVDVRLNTDFKDVGDVEYDKLIYTGPIDEYYGYCYGPLAYRSVRFETEELEVDNYQGNAVVNYTEGFDFDKPESEQTGKPYTRVIEHKHFEVENSSLLAENTTIISREYSQEWKPGIEPYYPINDEQNAALYQKYKDRAKEDRAKVRFGGRLGKYRYYDMDKVIEAALEAVEKER